MLGGCHLKAGTLDTDVTEDGGVARSPEDEDEDELKQAEKIKIKEDYSR